MVRILKTVVYILKERVKMYFKGSHIGKGSYFNGGTVFEGLVNIEKRTKLVNCYIGKGTDIASDSKFVGCKIGRYCIIGDKCENIYGHHPIKFYIGMNSKLYAPQKNGFAKKWLYTDLYKYADKDKTYYNVIGNDVYLTNDVKIIEGVKIGDGAVVTPGSVVTKNVPPYAIVRGNPAKVEAYRFKREDIDFLLDLKWWERDEEWIRNHVEYFSDIKILRTLIEEEEKNESK